MARTVMFYGDSNTHGTPPIPNFDPIDRYDRETRWTCLAAKNLGPDWIVIEEGLGGRTTVHDDPIEGPMRNGLVTLPAILHSHKMLDLVVVMLGTNDLKVPFGLSPYEIARGADKLMRVVKASECGPEFGEPKVLLICPPPVTESGCLAEMYRGGAEKSRRLAPEYEAFAKARGAAFLDAGQHVKVSPVDGVHWEAGEHAKLAVAVADKIRSMF